MKITGGPLGQVTGLLFEEVDHLQQPRVDYSFLGLYRVTAQFNFTVAVALGRVSFHLMMGTMTLLLQSSSILSAL